tara:strand:- start:683 stop:2647 length:1965 start_codon:yes stop_codon:yes gene_type:complete
MNKLVFILFFFLIGNSVFSQDRSSLKKRKQLSSNVNSNRLDMDSLSSRSSKQAVKNDKAKIQDYLIITQKNNTIQVDTILSVYKDYKFNYLQRDDFELLPFSNMGQTYNTLSHDFKSSSLIPGIGASAKHFNYMDVNDINYYRVPTPFTELMYKTAFEQGHVLDAFFTVNTSNQFNFSIAYKGMRSLGKYQHILSSTGNFRFTTNYNSKNNRYKLRTHLVKQDILNQENGGISDEDLIGFESGDPEFIDRSLFDPIFENAQNNLEGKRFHMDQSYVLFQSDSLNSSQISIGNLLTFEDKYYHFTQDSNDSFFGDAFVSSSISDKSTFENFYTEFNARYLNKTLGVIKASLGYNNYNYGYNSLVILNNQTITNRLLGDVLSFGAAYENKIGALDINGEVGFNIIGDLEGNFINGDVSYMFNDDIEAKAGININSKAPDFNFQLFQSDYLSYNWQNNFRNQQTKQLAIALKSKKYGSLQLDYNTIGNYLYFAKNEGASVKPFQHDGTLNYIRVKFSNEISYKKFALNNTILFQNVFDGDEVLNVPQLVTRHSFYYTNEFFKKALFLQTGLTFSYFSSYSMNAYDPLLAEFYTQNTTEIGDFPRIDFFINAKISQARIYLKAEHLNSSFTGYDYYSAPNYPYRDFTVRFGIVWNFFL